MSKSILLRAVSLLLGIFFCLSLIPAALAQTVGEDTSKNETIIHEINPGYYDLYLQQGESSSFNVSFKNNDKKALDIEPKAVDVPYSYYGFDESWMTISPVKVTVGPGAEQEFTVEINVPEDEDGGTYETYIAFTDDVVSEEDIYPQYVNAMYLSIMVPIYQKLALETTYISDSVEAGKEYEYTVRIKNIASRDITINPEFTRYTYDSFDGIGLDDDAIEISAPSTLKPDQIADMVIRIPVPKNATGTFNGYIDMNVDGDENGGIEPQLDLNLMVKQRPSAPYVETFITTNTDPITIEVSTYVYSSGSWLRSPAKDEDPSFELNLKHDSSPVDISVVKTTHKGNVNVGWNNFPIWSEDDNAFYDNFDRYYTETYMVPGAVGNWELEILPINVETFEYSITVGNSS